MRTAARTLPQLVLLASFTAAACGPRSGGVIRFSFSMPQAVSNKCANSQWLLNRDMLLEVFLDSDAEFCHPGHYMARTAGRPEEMFTECQVPEASVVISALMQIEDSAGPNTPVAMFFSEGEVSLADASSDMEIRLSQGIYRPDQIEDLQPQTRYVWDYLVQRNLIHTFDEDNDGCANLVEACDANLDVAGNTDCSLP